MKLDAWGGPSTEDLATGDEYDAEALRQYGEQGPLFSWYEDTGGYTYAHENPRAWALLEPEEVRELSKLVAIAKHGDHDQSTHGNRYGGGPAAATLLGATSYAPDTSSKEWKSTEKVIRAQGKGNCYDAAVTLAMNAEELGLRNVRIIQATVMGRGALEGVRFGHSWIEADAQGLSHPDAQGEVVFRNAYDWSSGNSVVMPDALYRHLGQVTDVHEYTAEEAISEMVAKGHYGPWEPAPMVGVRDEDWKEAGPVG